MLPTSTLRSDLLLGTVYHYLGNGKCSIPARGDLINLGREIGTRKSMLWKDNRRLVRSQVGGRAGIRPSFMAH